MSFTITGWQVRPLLANSVEMILEGEGSLPKIVAEYAQRNGRFVITSLMIQCDLIDSTTLRKIPIGRIETWLNAHMLA